ncbi:helix-turn-helix domain-containing protein [Rhodoblastus sp.]|uniref:helix-turn-helix domain-containing protein n=1 Tax=Rhodoblastus sp. TaxID=1962975 RepID=UPI003F9E7781
MTRRPPTPAKPALEILGHSIPETARITGLSQPTVERLIADGTLKSIKIGGRRLITAPAIRELLGIA